MARGDKTKSISTAKKGARKTQRKLQRAGASKRSAEHTAWDKASRARAKRSSGTASGRSKISKRTTRKPAGSTRKTKATGKTRR